jgi:hypothetical protein
MNIKLWFATLDFIIISFWKIFNAIISAIAINKLGCFWIFFVLHIIKVVLRLTFKIFLRTVYVSNWGFYWASTSNVIWIIKYKVCVSDRWRSSCYLTGLFLHLEEIVIRNYFQLKFSNTVHQLLIFIFQLFIL